MASIAIPPVFVIFTIIPEAFSPIIFYIVPFPVSPLPALQHKANVGTFTGTDMDDATVSGIFRYEDPINNPGFPYGQVLVMHGGGDTIAHLAIDYDRNRIAFRGGNPPSVGGTGTWRAWSFIATDADLANKVNIGEITALQAMSPVNGNTTLKDYIVACHQRGERIMGFSAVNLPDLPSSDGYWYDIFVITPASGWVYASKNYSRKLYKRYWQDGGWSGDWEEAATATPPEEHDLPLAEGISGAVKFSKDQFGKLLIPGIHVTTTRVVAAGETIATLPAEYRLAGPAGLRVLAGLGDSLSNLYIDPNGSIMTSAAVAAGAVICAGSIEFSTY